MASRSRPGRRSKRSTAPLDEFGGSSDGGLAIILADGTPVHMTPSRVAGALRYLVARMEFGETQGMPERVAMTAALGGEGVTYITRSLAAVLAYDSPASVAVVDMNWRHVRRPGLDSKKGQKAKRAREPGPTPVADGADEASKIEAEDAPPQAATLADAVERGVPVADIIRPTTNPRLSLVDAGEVPVARRPALVTSRELARVLDDLETHFDYLLFDLPPVLSSSEAMSLAELADGFVLVVNQGVTADSQVEAALNEMQASSALGVVLNRFSSRIPNRLRRLVGT